jgi:hypothetical protein
MVLFRAPKTTSGFCMLKLNKAIKFELTSAKQSFSTENFTFLIQNLGVWGYPLENKLCANMMLIRAPKTTSGFCMLKLNRANKIELTSAKQSFFTENFTFLIQNLGVYGYPLENKLCANSRVK